MVELEFFLLSLLVGPYHVFVRTFFIFHSGVGWSVNYLVKHNGVMIDASLQPQLSVSNIQDCINFTSPRDMSYLVLSTALNGRFDGFRKSSEQFTVDFIGLLPTYTTTKLTAVLKETWQTHLTSMKFSQILFMM